MTNVCDWYYDSDGDYVPASPDAWFDVFHDAEAAAEYWGGALDESEDDE